MRAVSFKRLLGSGCFGVLAPQSRCSRSPGDRERRNQWRNYKPPHRRRRAIRERRDVDHYVTDRQDEEEENANHENRGK